MNRVLVIADDLTGAAEIAGIGSRYGLPTRLVRDQLVHRPEGGLTVIDTDSRLLPASEAAATVWKFVEPLRAGQFDLVFKKSDSVLRGPVLAEIDAMLTALGRASALLVPQNQSRGRVIRGGEYQVEGVPLYASAFANDPQYPARTSNVLDGFVDFDKAAQDPANPAVFSSTADGGDHLHPSDAGYKAMGESIDLKLFTK